MLDAVDVEHRMQAGSGRRYLVNRHQWYDHARVQVGKQVRLAIDDQSIPEPVNVELRQQGPLKEPVLRQREAVLFNPCVPGIERLTIFLEPLLRSFGTVRVTPLRHLDSRRLGSVREMSACHDTEHKCTECLHARERGDPSKNSRPAHF